MVVIGLSTGGRFVGGVTKRSGEWLILFALGRLLGRVGCGGNRIGIFQIAVTDANGVGIREGGAGDFVPRISLSVRGDR